MSTFHEESALVQRNRLAAELEKWRNLAVIEALILGIVVVYMIGGAL